MLQLKAAGGAMGFASLELLLAYTPSEPNALAMDASTGMFYYWNGTVWTATDYQFRDKIETVVDDYLAATNGIIAVTTDQELRYVSGYRLWDTAEASGDGGLIADAAWDTSDFIPVTRGQCFRLTTTYYESARARNMVALFDANKTPLGSLVFSSLRNPSAAASELVRFNSRPFRARAQYFRVPADGYIRASTFKGYETTLQEVTFDAFLENFRWEGSIDTLRRIDRLAGLYTPIKDQTGYGYTAMTADSFSTQSFMAGSVAYPVKAGQYVNAQAMHSRVASSALVFFDASGTPVKFAPTCSPHSWTITTEDQGGLKVYENYIVPADGTVRLYQSSLQTATADSHFIVVTDEPVRYTRNYFDGTRDIEMIHGMSLGNITSYPTFIPDANFDSTRPVLLRAGTIVKISSSYKAMSGYAYPDRVNSAPVLAVNNGTGYFQPVPTLTVNDGSDATDEVRSVRYYCNEDADSWVQIRTLAGTSVKVEILSYDEFVADRQAVLNTARLVKNIFPNSVSSLPAVTTDCMAARPFVLIMKGEVMACRSPANRSWFSPVDTRNTSDLAWSFFADRFSVAQDLTDHVDYRTARMTGYCAYGFVPASPATFDYAGYYATFPQRIYSAADWQIAALNGELTVSELADTAYVLGFSTPDTNTSSALNRVSVSNPGSRSCCPPFLVKAGQAVRFKCNTGGSANQYFPAWYDHGTRTIKSFVEAGLNDAIPQAYEFYFRPSENAYLLLNRRGVGSAESASALEQTLNGAFSQLSIEFITDEEYEANTLLDDRRVIAVPEQYGLDIRLINARVPFDRSAARSATKGIIQFWQAGRRLFNLAVDLEIQGQGTASNASRLKLNHNLDLYNSKGKSVALKIADWRETEKLVLKAYVTERTHLRDTAGAELWRQCRRAHSYPGSLIYGAEVLDQLADNSDVRWATDAVCSTQGVPVSYTVGGQFYGLYTLRTKKDRSNYLLKKKIQTHIWLQSDYTLNGKYVDWFNFDYGAWEIANPDGFDAGVVPPAGSVKTAVDRFWSWLSDCNGGAQVFSLTYQDYIDLDNWMDFLLAAEMMRHSDGVNNNTIMNTWDGAKWYIHIYDMDWTFGAAVTSGAALSPTGRIYTNVGLFKFIYNQMQPQLKARYAELRQAGVFSMRNFESLFLGLNNTIPYSWHDDDEALWGLIDTANPLWILSWLKQRLAYFDSYFEYTGG
ncbi:CotH kinase family protein [Raoultella ornithinolytica]|uniref:CotH kinase family protein n=2 Tax=Raoultella ornithinolytica TaxID=54291 RepID=UPI002A90A64B|nr:CotH kinase family protein [Raoultella ornithinolytica]